MLLLEMSNLDLSGKRLLIRQDLNVPFDESGQVASDQRIQAALPTIKAALDKGAKVMLMSHLGRPTEGQYDDKYSLAPVAAFLSKCLNRSVPLIKNWMDGIHTQSDVMLLENVRFCEGETSNAEPLARKIADLCDVFVMDAFGCAHRAHASTQGAAKYAPIACAGPLLVAELAALSKVIEAPTKPLVAIVGGAKVSTKLTVLENLAKVCDRLILGGGIANTFIAARGHHIGRSLHEPELIDAAKKLMNQLDIPEVSDVRVASEFHKKAHSTIKAVDDIADDDMILDIGPETAAHYGRIVQSAQTILWNGPLGVFEFDHFAEGTRSIAEAIAHSSAYSVLGGGDVIAAVQQFNMADRFSYISTGGGAFLEFVEGKSLPGVAILEHRATLG